MSKLGRVGQRVILTCLTLVGVGSGCVCDNPVSIGGGGGSGAPINSGNQGDLVASPEPQPSPLSPSSPAPVSTPTPPETSVPEIPDPGKYALIEAENFTRALDFTADNIGGALKDDAGVDIVETTDVSGDYSVSYVEPDEWLEYDFELEPGQYNVYIRMASGEDGGFISLALDTFKVAEISFPNTGSLNDWETVNGGVITIPEGSNHTLRLTIEAAQFSLNWIEFSEAESLAGPQQIGAFEKSVTADLAKRPATQHNALVNLIRDAGIGHVRLTFHWADIETQNDLYDWSVYDNLVTALRAANIQIYGVVKNVPSWANGTALAELPDGVDAGAFMPDNLTDWTDFITQLSARYQSRVGHWIILDEPNNPAAWAEGIDAASYVSLLEAAYTAIKSIDNQLVVISAGLWGNGVDMGWEPEASKFYLQKLYDAGAKDYYDVLNIHPFQDPELGVANLQSHINATLDVMAANGDSAKLQVGALGWYTGAADGAVSDLALKDWLVVSYGQLTGVQRLFWHRFQDTGDDPAESIQNYGLVDVNLMPKAAYDGFKQP